MTRRHIQCGRHGEVESAFSCVHIVENTDRLHFVCGFGLKDCIWGDCVSAKVELNEGEHPLAREICSECLWGLVREFFSSRFQWTNRDTEIFAQIQISTLGTQHPLMAPQFQQFLDSDVPAVETKRQLLEGMFLRMNEERRVEAAIAGYDESKIDRDQIAAYRSYKLRILFEQLLRAKDQVLPPQIAR